MKKIALFAIYLTFSNTTAQNVWSINGQFTNAKEKEIRLTGFVGTKDTLLYQTKTDASGNFILSYPKKYSGAATIQVKDMSSLIVLLNKENFDLNWTDFKDLSSLHFIKSKENEWFQEAYAINVEVQKKLAGLNYLLPLYKNDPLNKEWTTKLENEVLKESSMFEEYQNQLPSTSYAKEYLNYRVVLQKLQTEKKTKEEETAIEKTFLRINFGSNNLYNSGLSKDFFDAYIKQILKLENKEEIINKFQAFSQVVKRTTITSPRILNEYSEYLIKHFEQYGLTEAAEKFALSLIDDKTCVIDKQRMPLLEQYIKMAIGNVAPNLEFTSTSKYKSLADLKSNYKVIVFGASWCEECKNEIPQFKDYAEVFKSKYEASIVFVSLDTDKEKYATFIEDLPVINSCDYKGWEGQNVKNYYVFATPSIYILDAQNKIVAKPINAVDTAKWLFSKY